jgi:hypothetical protein
LALQRSQQLGVEKRTRHRSSAAKHLESYIALQVSVVGAPNRAMSSAPESLPELITVPDDSV